MTKKRTSLDTIFDTQPTQETKTALTLPETSAQPEAETPVTPSKKKLKTPTLYLEIPVHKQLRTLQLEEDIDKMHDLFLEAIDLLFANRGLPSISELSEK